MHFGEFECTMQLLEQKNSVEESFSAIDTVLQNRYDLIPNLVELVKRYTKHEQDTLTKVIEMRSKLMQGWTEMSSSERFSQENALFNGLKSIFAISESYPELKADSQFLSLQEHFVEMENRLQAARRAYNSNIKILRDKKETFPSNIVASFMTIKDYAMFEADFKAKNEKISVKDIYEN